MEFLYQIDLSIFNFINQGLSNDLFDAIVPWFRNKYFWIPLYIFLIAYTILRFKETAYLILLTAMVCVLFSDQISSTVLKPTFERQRPCNNPELDDQVKVLAPCRNSFSFVSSHASNHFTVATFFAMLFLGQWKKRRYFLYCWAALVSLSQVYVGLHYFSDIFIGAGLGILIAFVLFRMLDKFYLKTQKTAIL